jgi:hypothetical protein
MPEMSSQGNKEEPREAAREALDHAWSWFALHADHRLRALNFFFLAMAVLVTAYVTALERAPRLAVGIGVFGALMAFVFNRLELRIRTPEGRRGSHDAASEAACRLWASKAMYAMAARLLSAGTLPAPPPGPAAAYAAVLRRRSAFIASDSPSPGTRDTICHGAARRAIGYTHADVSTPDGPATACGLREA